MSMLAPVVLLLLLTSSCGSDAGPEEGGGDSDGAGGAASGAGGTTSGAGGQATGAAGAAPGAGGAGLPGLEEVCAEATGALLPAGPCFKTCSHDGSSPPFYDDTSDCSRLSYRCMPIDYCAPATRCTTNAACEQQGGPGWVCVTTVGPFESLCLLSCATDTDCPPSGRSTPYRCKPIDGVGVCRY